MFNKPYVTKQYIPYENQMDENYGFKSVTPEEKTTMGYEEIIVNIPAGSIIEDYIADKLLKNIYTDNTVINMDYDIDKKEVIGEAIKK